MPLLQKDLNSPRSAGEFRPFVTWHIISRKPPESQEQSCKNVCFTSCPDDFRYNSRLSGSLLTFLRVGRRSLGNRLCFCRNIVVVSRLGENSISEIRRRIVVKLVRNYISILIVNNRRYRHIGQKKFFCLMEKLCSLGRIGFNERALHYLIILRIVVACNMGHKLIKIRRSGKIISSA